VNLGVSREQAIQTLTAAGGNGKSGFSRHVFTGDQVGLCADVVLRFFTSRVVDMAASLLF
jgi:hypothetical protein